MVVIPVKEIAIAPFFEGSPHTEKAPFRGSPGSLEGVFATSNRVKLILTPEFNRDICYIIDIDREEWAKLKEAL